MTFPLGGLFTSAGIDFFQGSAETIDTQSHTIHARCPTGVESSITYDRLILAAGSSVVRPRSVAGLQQHAFDIDTLNSAAQLEAHLESLASLPATNARDTIVICGAGFTGIELAAELPKRFSHVANLRVILVESADALGPELGPGPRPVIEKALKELNIEVRLGSAVAAVNAEGVNLASGERIETKTAIWTAGMRATPLTQQINGPRDNLSRIQVDRYLRAVSTKNVFVTGDAASALADTDGHHALMSCQHALQLGRISGHNAAAELLGQPLVEYSQAEYTCCLDLGSWGAVVSGGWEREVRFSGDLAKKVKEHINQKLIYPPDYAQEALEAANHVLPVSDELVKRILAVVGYSSG